jgi:glycosyltransferase involved in cell wall biosynthesis
MSRALLYITNARVPTEKAHGLQMLKTLEAFSRLGMSVRLVVPRRKNHIFSDPFDFYGLKPLFEVIYLPNLFGFLEDVSRDIYFVFQRAAFGTLALFFALFALEGTVYTRDITLAFFLSVFSCKTVVYEDHEPKRSCRALYRMFLRRIDKKVLVAKELEKVYELFGIRRDSYIYVPNGVDLTEFDSVGRDSDLWKSFLGIHNEKVVLYAGHFYLWKGVYTLLDAAKGIPAKVVLIGGTTHDRGELEAYRIQKQLDNVITIPFMPHKEVIVFMKSADVLVLPNTGREERSSRYTTPIKLFEYMASGVPIVASNIPSVTPFLKDAETAYLCDSDAPFALAEKVCYILNHPTDAAIVGRRAASEVRRYTWENRAKRILSFLS